MPGPNPLEYLIPGNPEMPDMNDPEALARWIADNQQPGGGAPPPEEDVFGEAPPQAPPGQRPPAGGQQPPGEWGGFLGDPANRAFLINAGIQLMSGGWGGWGEQVGRALAAGFQGGHAAERAQQGLDSVRLPQDRTRVGPRGRQQPPVRRRTGLNPEAQQEAQAEIGRLQQVQAFLARPNLTEAEWAQEAQPGGLIHQALGPGAQFGNKEQYLVQVQQRIERLFQLPRRTGTVSTAEMLRLGQSELPSEQAEFQIIARQLLGNPGVGFRWKWNRETGQVDREALTGRPGAPGGPGGRFVAAGQAGVDQARLSINSLREFIQSPDHWGMIARAPQQHFRTGPYARVIGSMRDAVMSYMYARSGATINVRELEHYLDTKMPTPLDSQSTILYKLADLELAMMLLSRRQGDQVPSSQLRDMYNNVRRLSGLPEVGPQTFEQMVPNLIGGTGVPVTGIPPPTAPPGTTVTPPVTPQAPPPTAPPVTPAPPTQQELEALKKRYGLE